MKKNILGLFLTLISTVAMGETPIENNICINDNFGDSLPNPIITCTVMKKNNVLSKCYMGSLNINNLFNSSSKVYISDCSLKQFATKTTLLDKQKLKIRYQSEGRDMEKVFSPDSDGFFRAIIKLDDSEKHRIVCETQCASNHYFPVEF